MARSNALCGVFLDVMFDGDNVHSIGGWTTRVSRYDTSNVPQRYAWSTIWFSYFYTTCSKIDGTSSPSLFRSILQIITSAPWSQVQSLRIVLSPRVNLFVELLESLVVASVLANWSMYAVRRALAWYCSAVVWSPLRRLYRYRLSLRVVESHLIGIQDVIRVIELPCARLGNDS